MRPPGEETDDMSDDGDASSNGESSGDDSSDADDDDLIKDEIGEEIELADNSNVTKKISKTGSGPRPRMGH